jgi:2-(1,2-epoxy-1,2-dihydrophenyl)acetyl-CoA isomerase
MFKAPEDNSFLVELEAGVLRLTFNRPEAGNSIPPGTVPALRELFEQAQATPSVRCILISGKGKMFSAGGDVAGFSRSLAQDAAARQADFAERLPRLAKLVEVVAAFDRPIVAAVRGAAAGAGLLYPLVADVVIGDDSATFVFAHQRVGLSPDGGVTALLPAVVGERMARMLLLTAAKVDAPEALRLGILHRIVPAEALDSESLKTAQRLARAPQRAVTLAKQLLKGASAKPLAEQLDAETAGIVACVGDADFSEGVRAFMEKRSAIFPSAQDDA